MHKFKNKIHFTIIFCDSEEAWSIEVAKHVWN
jgi:hypothetical protein